MKKKIEINQHESPEYYSHIESLVHERLSKIDKYEAIVVVNLVLMAWRNGLKFTQRSIAQSALWIGAHPTWEKKAIEAGFIDTSSRRVREIVRNLRVIYGMPILSDEDGYFFPFTRNDAPIVLRRIESEVYSRNVSSVETYRELQKTFSMKSDFIDHVDQLNKSVENRFTPTRKRKSSNSNQLRLEGI